MSDTVIRVDGLSKLYRIGGPGGRQKTLRETMADAVQAPFRRAAKLLRGQAYGAAELDQTIWALKDVSLEVKRGEVVGIIGRNGTGKTTLLKILSRITEPTEGWAEIQGRVGSLLEVGTGFHLELTGRENIYLNGAILGMKRAEIERKFDEIVAFAEVEKFIDTPVKHYSSGMYVRLAFAVAAHLEPEILMVDEVLAVGDAAFQNKCLGKMGDVSQQGRTVLFVSHSMSTIQTLCSRCLLLREGVLVNQGEPARVIREYLRTGSPGGEAILGPETPRAGNGKARYVRARILGPDAQPTTSLPMGSGFTVELEFCCNTPLFYPGFGVVLRGPLRERIAQITTRETYGEMPPTSSGGVVRLHVERLDLLPGTYYLSLGLSLLKEQIDWVEDALEFEVTPEPVYPTGKLPKTDTGGIIYVPCAWSYAYE